MYRQGDILLIKCDDDINLIDCEQSIEGQEYENEIILALGEATGHKHRLVKQNAILKKASNTSQYFLLVKNPSDLVHEEHNKITLPAGKYRVVRQREYSPEEIKYVAD